MTEIIDASDMFHTQQYLEGLLVDSNPAEKKIILQKRYSNRPDDSHLSYVLCIWRNEYVVWMHNSNDDSFHHGHYFQPGDQDAALRCYLSKGYVHKNRVSQMR